MFAPPHEPAPLSALRAFGRALASNPNELLVGFLQPANRADQPVVVKDGRFVGAILYAMTRSNGAITAVTFQLLGDTISQGVATLREDGDWQIPPLILNGGTTTMIVTAYAGDGLSAQAQIAVNIQSAA